MLMKIGLYWLGVCCFAFTAAGEQLREPDNPEIVDISIPMNDLITSTYIQCDAEFDCLRQTLIREFNRIKIITGILQNILTYSITQDSQACLFCKPTAFRMQCDISNFQEIDALTTDIFQRRSDQNKLPFLVLPHDESHSTYFYKQLAFEVGIALCQAHASYVDIMVLNAESGIANHGFYGLVPINYIGTFSVGKQLAISARFGAESIAYIVCFETRYRGYGDRREQCPVIRSHINALYVNPIIMATLNPTKYHLHRRMKVTQ